MDQPLLTAAELDRIRLIIKMMRRKLSLGGWVLNDEAVTAADVDLLQRIVDAGAGADGGECEQHLRSWHGVR